jgi:hypothetical protein
MRHRVSFVLEGNVDAVRRSVRCMLDGVGFTEVSFELLSGDRKVEQIEQIGHDGLVELYESVKDVVRPTCQQMALLHDCEVALGVLRSQRQEKIVALRRCSLAHEALRAQAATRDDRALADPVDRTSPR